MSKKIRPKIRIYETQLPTDLYTFIGIDVNNDDILIKNLMFFAVDSPYYKVLKLERLKAPEGYLRVKLTIEKLQNLKSYGTTQQ